MVWIVINKENIKNVYKRIWETSKNIELLN